MGRFRRIGFCLLVAAVAAARPAAASTITLSDAFDPAPDVLFAKSGGSCSESNSVVTGQVNGACDTLSFSMALDGFDPATDAITSATLGLVLYDDSADDDRETADLTLGSTLFQNNMLIESGSTSGNASSFTFTVSANIDANGQLASVLLSRGNQGANNDFFFADSVLTASVTRTNPAAAPLLDPVEPIAPVPEPGTLLLLGTGLLAAARSIRRRTAARQPA